MRQLLVHMHDDDGQEARLTAAANIARTLGGHLICLHVTPYPAFVAGDPFGGVHLLPAQLEAEQQREERIRTSVEEQLAGAGISYEWVHRDGEPARELLDVAALADLIILRRAGHAMAGTSPLPVVADVAIHARAPVLAVPPDRKGFAVEGPALLAWNGSAEAAHALRFSVPLLAHASEVHIVTVEEGGDAPPEAAIAYLRRYGITGKPRVIEAQHRRVADALIAEAQGVGASYLAMGAYGHSRLREHLLGGVTRDLLAHSSVPLFMAH